MPPDQPKLNSLTGIRLYLALFVFFFHGINQAHLGIGRHALDPGLLDFLNFIFNGGFAVGSFFILSGFVMWYSYSERNWTARQFLGNRIARLFPVYLLGIIIVLFRWNHLLLEFQVSTAEALRRLILSLLMLQSWQLDWRTTQMFNGPGWTLSVEMFFYATFPLLFRIHQWSPKMFTITSSGIVITNLILSAHGLTEGFPLCLKNWGLFNLGLLLGYAWKNGMRINLAQWMISLLLFLGFQASRSINPEMIIYLFPAIIIIALATADASGKRMSMFSSKWSVLGGEISYAIYILHAPIQTIVYSIFFHCGIFLLQTDNLSIKLLYLTLSLIATISASYLAWRFVEIPARKWIVNRFARHYS
ncbi:MAG: acyltransferase [Luteolibacter sp.]